MSAEIQPILNAPTFDSVPDLSVDTGAGRSISGASPVNLNQSPSEPSIFSDIDLPPPLESPPTGSVVPRRKQPEYFTFSDEDFELSRRGINPIQHRFG